MKRKKNDFGKKHDLGKKNDPELGNTDRELDDLEGSVNERYSSKSGE